MRAALREAERLEWRLKDLVNEAYGLTLEVRLMWVTALTAHAAHPPGRRARAGR
jgi:hypothetical protein